MATSIRLSSETENKINVLANETGRSKAYYLRQLIESGLNEIEDYFLSEKMMERVRHGARKNSSLEEMEKELGLVN
ncbi:MAG TPA: ribbon-helix-helix protein, CopG family [Methyloprofundus sp.]|nr:ribbon-helix-helix protein, CopG family [Methyloprofundus sp.]HIL78071.1 ribbon-helix-helix protein, CopG family [Methylococcales bacterium]